MRIRKNAKLSSLLSSTSSHASAPETHVCQLNQSPWDAMTFSPETYAPSLNHQFEPAEDSFNNGNGSLGDSFGAVDSMSSMMDMEEKNVMFRVDDMAITDNDMEIPDNIFDNDDEDDEFEFNKGKKPVHCVKTDGRGWQCRNKQKDGHTLCENHLSSPKSNSKKTIGPRIRKGRGRAAKNGSSSNSNPYEFYYYSGFGPLWGKRRGDRGSEGNKLEGKEVGNSSQNDKTTSSSSQIDIEGFDYVDEEEEEEQNGDSGKKRMRKPVKARSLKSLM